MTKGDDERERETERSDETAGLKDAAMKTVSEIND